MSSRSGPAGNGRHLFAVPAMDGDGAEGPGGASALDQLAELAARSADGELVCSSSGGEIHVYLQGGRIAWATCTRQRHAFTDHLKRITGAGDDVIEAVVAECSRTRRPIGEALIAWNVATQDQVRASLLHQIRMALEAAAQASDTRTLFLERSQYRRYDRALTFQLGEAWPGLDGEPRGAGGPAGAPDAADPPAAAAAAATDPAVDLERMDGFAAAAVLSATGMPLTLVGDRERLGHVAGVSHQLLQAGQRLAIDLGAGLCRQVDVEGEDAHVLVYSTRATGGARAGAWLRIVLVLRDLAVVGVAKLRIGALAAGLDDGRAP